jgi:F-type H+-transporting ATPase subunit epsilon
MAGDTKMVVELVSPERVIWTGETTMVVVRTLSGETAFQPGHAPFIAALVNHHCRVYRPGGDVQSIAVHRGFVEVGPHPDGGTRVTILSDEAELDSEIDIEQARRDKDDAEATLRHEHDAEAVAKLAKANARLAAAKA